MLDSNPVTAILLLLGLGLLDHPLTKLSRRAYFKYMYRYIEFESIYPTSEKSSIWRRIASLLVLSFFLLVIWKVRELTGSESVGILYRWLVGFSLGTYLLIDLRHLESLLLNRLYAYTEDISGKLSYRASFSMKISAVHFFSTFLILAAVLVIQPDISILGIACAAIFLALRNLLLA